MVSRRKNKRKKGGLLLGLILGVMFFTGALWLGNIIVDGVMSGGYFSVKEIAIKGVVNSDRAKIDAAARNLLGKNIFDVDSAYIGNTNEPWIERVELRKKFPETVEIVVYEQRAVVNVKKDGKCWYVTAGLKMIPKTCADTFLTMKEAVSKKDFSEFIQIYESFAALKGKRIELRKSHFVVYENGAELLVAYDKSSFSGQYRAYTDRIKKRYSSVSYADLRIEGKIFVNGVLNVSG